MSTIIDGGPAFPTKHPASDPRESGFYTESGMTLRDYFAGLALQGLCANPDQQFLSATWPKLAKLSYDGADAMLKARQPAPADGAQGSAEGAK